MNSDELLKYALEHGMINMLDVQEQVEMNKREEILERHPYDIWKGKDGNWHTYLPDKEKGRIPKKSKSKSKVEQEVIDYWKQELSNPTVEDIFNKWNTDRYEKGKIRNSTYHRNIQFYERHYKEFGKNRIKELSPEEFEKFLEDELFDKHLTAKAFSGLKGITKGLITRAKREKYIDYNGEQVIQELEVSKSDYKKIHKTMEQEVFTEKEYPGTIEYLMEHLDSKNLGILLMFLTGIRVGELAALTHEDLHENTITINKMERRSFVEKGKYSYDVTENSKSEAGNRDVIIPKGFSWVMTELKRLNPGGKYLFVNESGERLTTGCFRSRIYRVCKKVHVVSKSPHKARKTYISILLDNNVDKKTVQTVAGHTDNSCTESSYHRARKDIDREMEIISAVPELQTRNFGYQRVSRENQ